MSATSAAAHPGMILAGRYRLDSPIASGGMAQVWRGQDLSLDRAVAIKILHPHLAGDDAFVLRFRREAVASARLSHPSIVAVYDTVSQPGVEAIVMELIEGRTLRSVLDEVGVLPPTLASAKVAPVSKSTMKKKPALGIDSAPDALLVSTAPLSVTEMSMASAPLKSRSPR